MVSAGQTLVNPVTGERMTFIRTSADTGGEYVLVELRAEPDAFVAAAHVHPGQTETFEAVSGTLGAKVAGKRIEARGRRQARGRARTGAHVVERGKRGARLPLRDPARAGVRVVDRDDVLARGRRPDQRQRDAEPVPAGGDRSRAATSASRPSPRAADLRSDAVCRPLRVTPANATEWATADANLRAARASVQTSTFVFSRNGTKRSKFEPRTPGPAGQAGGAARAPAGSRAGLPVG
jgi:hypothetical protein